MTREYRILARALDGPDESHVSDDGTVCIHLIDCDWVVYEGALESVLAFYAAIEIKLPAVLAHLDVQKREVGSWETL